MHGPVFTKWIHSIGTKNKSYISTHHSKLWILKVKKFSLSSIHRVSNLLIIFPMLHRIPTHQFRIPRVGEHTFQTINQWKVPHYQGRNFSLHLILFIRISFVINTLRTDNSLVLILYHFLNSVGIQMIITSLVLTHATYRTLRVELILFTVQNTMVGTCVYFIHT
jgi:hypothetical protein